MKLAGFLLFFLTAADLAAGVIYGALRDNNRGVPGVEITITGPRLNQRLTTAPDGSFRLFIKESGKYHFHVTYQGKSGDADIFSYDDPVKYDFDLRFDRARNNYQLSRR